MITSDIHEEKAFENIVEKGENASDQHFFLFFTMFSILLKTYLTFGILIILILMCANILNLAQFKILSFGEVQNLEWSFFSCLECCEGVLKK